MTSPRVSIVMPAYNAGPYIEETVATILAQSVEDFELVIVDDGSTDDTVDRIEAIADPRIRLIRVDHGGLGAAENTGLAHATGPYLARLDADDLFHPRLLEKQLDVLDRYPETAGVGVWSRRFGRRQFLFCPPTDPPDIKRRLRRHWVLNQPVLYRTSAVSEVGGFRNVQSDDWDLWIRLARRHDLRVIPEYLASIRTHPESMSARFSLVDDRRDVLKMRLLAVRTLGLDSRAAVGIGMAALRVGAAYVHDRIGSTPRRRRRLPPTIDRVPPISVVVPTYGRPQLLRRCLDALARQTVLPAQIVVVYRPEDRDTAAFLEEWEAVDPGHRTPTSVSEPGLQQALAAGTNASTAEVVAYVDDDGVPRPDWVAELGRGFMDPTVGAVGGRILDRVNGEVVQGRVRTPGLIRWYGRIIWGHNRESDHYGDVHWLTGSNLSIRRRLVQIDMRLLHQPNGLAMANDMDSTLAVRRSGFRVLFGSHIVVEHDTTSYRDPVLGSRVSQQGVERSVANHAYALLKYMPRWRHPFLFLWGYLMGSRSMAGPGRVLVELPRNPRRAMAMVRRIPYVWKGRRLGARMYREWRARGSEPPIRRERSAVDVGAARNPSA